MYYMYISQNIWGLRHAFSVNFFKKKAFCLLAALKHYFLDIVSK